MQRQHLFAAFFFAVLLYLLYEFYRVFHFFLGPLSWAALLALVFYPSYRIVVRTVRHREGLAAFMFTTAVIMAVIVPALFAIGRMATESVVLVQNVRQAHESGELEEALQRLRASSVGRVWNEQVTPRLAKWNVDLPSLAVKASNAVSKFVVAQVGGMAANVFHFIISFFFGTFALFFFFRDGERMVRGLRELIPMEAAHKDAILQRLYDTLSAVVQGTLATAVAQGVLAGIGFWLFDVPFAALLGCATAFLSLIPMVGPLVWVGVVVYLIVDGAYLRAAALTAWCVVLVGTADNVIRPLIIGGRTRIPTIFLFFGILGGLQAYGFLGVFLGPALIAILVAFLQIYKDQYAIAGEEVADPITRPEESSPPDRVGAREKLPRDEER